MTDLPAPVARFRDLALASGPAALDTAVFEATAWMRRPGMPRIPLEFTMSHLVGHAFVHEIRLGRRPLAFRFGLDAYVDGHGLMQVGPSLQHGLEFDQGALIALWAEILAFPAAWQDRSDLRWEPLDEAHALLVVPGPEGEIPITVGFDTASGLPITFEADRYKADGPKVRWIGRTAAWGRFEGRVLAPARFTAQWADEPDPWLEMTVRRVRLDVPVDGALARGRSALARAEAAIPDDAAHTPVDTSAAPGLSPADAGLPPARNPRWAELPAGARLFRLAHLGFGAVGMTTFGYLWWCALARRRTRKLGLAIGFLSLEGLALLVGRGNCPFGPFQRRLGDPVPMFELVLPPRAAKAAVPALAIATVAGIVLATVRRPARSRIR